MYRFLLEILEEQKYRVSYFALLSVSIGMVDLITVYLLSNALQFISENSETNNHLQGFINPSNINLYCFLSLLLKFVLHLVYKISLPFYIYKLQAEIRDRVFDNLYEDFTDKVDSSSFSENYFKLNAATTHVAVNMLYPLFQLLTDFVICAIIIVFIISQQPIISISIIVFFACFYFFWSFSTSEISKGLGEKRNRALEHCTQWTRFANDHHIQFKSLNIIKNIKTKYNSAVRDYSDSMVKFKIISDFPRVFFEFIIILFVLASLFVMANNNFQMSSSQNTDEILAVFLLLPRLLPFLNSFTTVLNTVANQKDSINVLSKVYSNKNYLGNKMIEENLSIVKVNYKDLVLKNDRVEIKKIKELNFSVGNLYCIVGASGSGKSTLVKSLAGLHSASHGEVYIKGLTQVSTLQHLVGSVAFCPQTIPEVDISVDHFLKLGFLGEKHRITEVHKNISLDEFHINDNLTQLSGGQRQRVLIMKTILHPAFMYIFDEPTSGLDKESSIKLIEYLKLKLANSIVICVTHDTTLMSLADEIIQIEDVH